MWSLATPLALLLLPLPLLAGRLMPPAASEGGALWVPDAVARTLGAEPGRWTLTAATYRLLPWLIWIALVIALAGPRVISPTPALPVSGRDIVLVLDLSGSMDRKDFEIDGQPVRRLDAVKKVATNFVRGREGDRIGLVIFAERAYFAAAPSFDLEGVARAVEEAAIGIAGRSTAIGEGLGLALKRLEQSDAKSRVVILLSDGANNAGTVGPRDVAALARDLGIRVHTIALGANDLESGTDDNDAVDTATLRNVAALSGGTAFRVKTTRDLVAVSATIDAMETSRGKAPPAEVFTDLWIYPAMLALGYCLLLAGAELGVRRVIVERARRLAARRRA